jgi:hypothetical protein
MNKLIGLYNIEPFVFNTALMQISNYHKSIGDTVEWFIDYNINLYDKIYCSSLFNFTDKSQVPEYAICGGTGFDISSKLPEEIENSDLDYSIYQNCKTSYIWFSRGCVRNCPFCIVREKEGYIHQVNPHNLNPKGTSIHIQDNNFFANKDWKITEDYLIKWNQPVIFSSGIDIRLFNSDHASFINSWSLKRTGSIHIAWDNPRENLIDKIKYFLTFIKPYLVTCYVLIGYWSTETEDLLRVNALKDLGVTPYAMPYLKSNKYQKSFCRWVNNNFIFKSVSWNNYKYNPKHNEIRS